MIIRCAATQEKDSRIISAMSNVPFITCGICKASVREQNNKLIIKDTDIPSGFFPKIIDTAKQREYAQSMSHT